MGKYEALVERCNHSENQEVLKNEVVVGKFYYNFECEIEEVLDEIQEAIKDQLGFDVPTDCIFEV